MKIREMIRLSIEDSERWRGGLGNGETEGRQQGRPTPARADRPVDLSGKCGAEKVPRPGALCRVVGFIPISKGAVTGLPSGMW